MYKIRKNVRKIGTMSPFQVQLYLSSTFYLLSRRWDSSSAK